MTAEEQLLWPICMMPVQWAGLVGKASENRPEVRLMAAILEDALRCYSKSPTVVGGPGRHDFEQWRRSKRRELQAEAAEWFFGGDDAQVTFGMVCDVLGINIELARVQIKAKKFGRREFTHRLLHTVNRETQITARIPRVRSSRKRHSIQHANVA